MTRTPIGRYPPKGLLIRLSTGVRAERYSTAAWSPGQVRGEALIAGKYSANGGPLQLHC